MRIRTIKPEFWHHPVMARLPASIQLIAIGLLNAADDEGYFRGDPNLVKADISPFTESSVSIHGALTALVKVGWIQLSEHPEQGSIGRVVNFAKHQNINRPSASKLKTYWITESSLKTHGALTEPSLLDQGSGNRDQGTCVQGKESTHTNGKLLEQFKTQLSAEFKRKPMIVWPRLEEEALVQICRRPDAAEEYRELLVYRKQNPAYFPRSIGSLLEGWDKTLDQARSFVKTDANGHPQKSLLEKIADEDLARIKREFGGGSK